MKFNLFNFLEKKVDAAEISPVTQKLLEQIAFKELALHIAISYIANTMSKCEIKTFEKGVEVKDKLYYMLNVSPNPNQNSSQFINKFVEKYFYDGHSLIIPKNDGLYCADSFDIEDSNPLKENIFFNVAFNCYTLPGEHRAKDVFYMKLDNKNVKAIVDSLYLHYGEVISTALAAYKRTNGTKYKLLLEQYRAGDAVFEKLYNDVIQKQLKTFIENDNAVYPQFKGLDLQEFSSKTPHKTDDIVAMRKEIFETTAQAFKIPLSMMYGNITNMNEIVKVYLSFCIDPLADMVSEEFTRKYHGFNGWKDGSYIKVDTSCINHVDILEVANEVYNLVGAGFSLDELRDRLDKQKLNTEFSRTHFLSKNFVPAEDMLNPETMKGGE
jgi:HK97 family phage portal protein